MDSVSGPEGEHYKSCMSQQNASFVLQNWPLSHILIHQLEDRTILIDRNSEPQITDLGTILKTSGLPPQ
jgi:hypothetical protein